jgi:hypothetical protein
MVGLLFNRLFGAFTSIPPIGSGCPILAVAVYIEERPESKNGDRTREA